MKDIGSMVYNMNLTRNSSARGNVLDKFNACKEFVSFETDALITLLAMRYFGIQNFNADKGEVIPPHIQHAEKESKLNWLHDCVRKMIQNDIVCRPEDFVNTFEDVENEEEKEEICNKDDVYSYATSHINLGLLLKNADDAVKEGDGERIIRCWRFFLLFYKAYGHHKYAVATFHLITRVSALLTPALAEQLTWNRTVNRHGGKGRNISCDLRLEQLNCLTKELLHNLGVNLDEKNAERESLAFGYLEKLIASVESDLMLAQQSGHHKDNKKEKDFKHLVEHLSGHNIFKFKAGRKSDEYEDFECNLLKKLEISDLTIG